MASADRVVIDSGVFVNLFTGGASDNPEWLPHSKRLLEFVQDGSIDAYVAAITIPEVFGNGAVRGDHLKPKVRRNVLAKARSWFDQNRVTVVELSTAFAFQSAEMAQELQLKGADASILQALSIVKAKALCTWDSDLLKCAAFTPPFPVLTPAAYIEQSGLPFIATLDIDLAESEKTVSREVAT